MTVVVGGLVVVFVVFVVTVVTVVTVVEVVVSTFSSQVEKNVPFLM